MQKILSTLALISSLAILLVPMVAQAAACSVTTCTQGQIPATEVTAGCTCGGEVATASYFCCAAASPHLNISLASCPAICGGTGGGVGGAGASGPIESCTMTRNVGVTGCPLTGVCLFATTPQCGICCLLQTLYNVTDWIFVILVSIAGLFVILGAMNLIMSAGDPSKVTSGRQYVMYAVIGLIVGLLARAIPAIVRLAVGA